MKEVLKLLRVKHYIKNFLVLIPLVFSKNFFEGQKLLAAFLGMIAFCLCCSTVYIINDIRDIEKDKRHPVKKNRPIASGKISIHVASIIAVVLMVLSIILVFVIYKLYAINIYFALGYLLLYLLINVAYSLGLKNKPIIDVAILALGFLIRVLFGGIVVNVQISNWLYLTILSISFYLGLGKRRNELVKYEGKETRNVLADYTKDFLDKNLYSCMTLSIVFYSLWAMEYANGLMLWSIPIVMLIAMKYSLNIEATNSEGDPVEVIMNDKCIMVLGAVYILYIFTAIYFFR